jgi:hypothetical protein
MWFLLATMATVFVLFGLPTFEQCVEAAVALYFFAIFVKTVDWLEGRLENQQTPQYPGRPAR